MFQNPFLHLFQSNIFAITKVLFDNPENYFNITGSDLFCLSMFDNNFGKQLKLNSFNRKQVKTLKRRGFT